jgi:hypothetical protein
MITYTMYDCMKIKIVVEIDMIIIYWTWWSSCLYCEKVKPLGESTIQVCVFSCSTVQYYEMTIADTNSLELLTECVTEMEL